jgi:hypothetical protein
MNSTDQLVGQESWFRVRPKFLAGCAAVVVVLILPDVIARVRILEPVALLSAAFAILVGWVLLLKDSPPKRTWRSVITLIASAYMTVSLPVFLFELSPWRWFVRHPWHSWFSMYARPWVHWGYFFVCLSVVCAFLGRGRARIAFVTGGALLMVLREAAGTWVF